MFFGDKALEKSIENNEKPTKPKRDVINNDKLNSDNNSNGKKPGYISTGEKLNKDIKVPNTNLITANNTVKSVKVGDGNHIGNKLKNFDITNDEDDIFFTNNLPVYSSLVDDDKEEGSEDKNDEKKEKKNSYLENGKYKDVKIPQKYNNYSSSVFKNTKK